MGSSHAPARASVRSLAPAARLGAAVLVAAAFLADPGRSLAAAPSPQPVDPFPTVETWIDGSIEAPPDAPSGAKVFVGATFWNTRDHALFPIDGLVFRLFPKQGKAAPSVAKATQDSPGHLVAQLAIPKGGIGRVEVDTSGKQCTADGTCKDAYQPLRIAGTGPPPEAPLSALVHAELLPITGDVVAGRPARIVVNVQPIGLWPVDSFQLPDTLEITSATTAGGAPGSAQLKQDPPGPGQPYQGSIRIPDPGQVVLTAAFVDASGSTQPIADVLGPIQVIGSVARPDAGTTPRPAASAGAPGSPAPASSGDDAGPPWLILGAVVVLVLGLGLFLGEPLTRRLRRGPGGEERR